MGHVVSIKERAKLKKVKNEVMAHFNFVAHNARASDISRRSKKYEWPDFIQAMTEMERDGLLEKTFNGWFRVSSSEAVKIAKSTMIEAYLQDSNAK